MLLHPNLLKQKQYYGNLLLKTTIGADRTGKPTLRCSLLLHSSLTPLPGQWDRRQSSKYTLGATFIIISQNFLIEGLNLLGVQFGQFGQMVECSFKN